MIKMEAQGSLTGCFLPWVGENFWVQSYGGFGNLKLSAREDQLKLETKSAVVTEIKKHAPFQRSGLLRCMAQSMLKSRKSNPLGKVR